MPGALSTDLYEITMAAGYVATGATGSATFELWVRELPPTRQFLVAAGLEQVLAYLESLRFTGDDIAFLRSEPALQRAPATFFDDYLPTFRFTGEVWALPEGTPFFAQEPLLRVTAPLPEAQLVETAVLSTLLYPTAVASKAVRVVEAAAGRPVVEFGGRRAHGMEAAMCAARAAYIGGCVGTSNVDAGSRFGIPLSGTMAHSWVMAHASELEAFRRYVDVYGDATILLIDTYDTVEAARTLSRSGLRPAAVRLDSGDLAALSREVRRVLDDGGLGATKIFASGDLDENRIADLLASGAPVDGFGVGTALSTSNDAPALSGVYKLVETLRDGQPVPTQKLSTHKQTHPGRKQVWRVMSGGTAIHDILGLRGEATPPSANPLLHCVMREGRRVTNPVSVAELQAGCAEAVGRLPANVRRLRGTAPYHVDVSADLARLTRRAAAALGQTP